MRIISGKYRGRKILGDNIIGTRPTMDRVKESLFSMIQNKIQDSICLDLFAGSGSLGIESLSNGAKKCFFVDKNIVAINVIKENLKDIENATVLNCDYKNALESFFKNNIKFDIIFLDPPYKFNLIQNSLDLIKKYDLLKINGIIICEYEQEIFNFDKKIIKEKKYGSKNIKIYINE